MLNMLPRGFRYGFDDAVACPHREATCCDPCRDEHEELVAVDEFTYWIADPAHREERRQRVAADAQRATMRETREPGPARCCDHQCAADQAR